MRRLPPVNLHHLIRLSDETGILQFAKFGVRDPASGYATDDNARALVLAARLRPSQRRNQLAKLYLGFLLYAQDDGGQFQQWIGYDRSRPGIPASEDCFGRCVWACGEVIVSDLPGSMKRTAEFILWRAWPHLETFRHVRGWANGVQGLAAYYRATRQADTLEIAVQMGERLLAKMRAHSQGSWIWFEDIVTYEPGRLPLALIHLYTLTGDSGYRDAAQRTLGFLSDTLHVRAKTQREGSEKVPARRLFVPVGNRGWYSRSGPRAFYDQQPVDTGSMVEAYVAAAATFGDHRYIRMAGEAMAWFFGANTGNVALYDPATGGCYDGLNPEGANLNLGAESTIVYLLARLAFAPGEALVRPSLSVGASTPGPRASRPGEGDRVPRERAWLH